MEQSSKETRLSQLKEKLSAWRKEKKGRYIPAGIKAEVVELLSDFSPGFLQRELSINGKSIRAWKSEPASPPVFSRMPELVIKKPETLALRFSRCSDGTLAMEGDLSAEQWLSALVLLREAR